MIYIWSLVFGTPMIQILALYFDFEGAKNIHGVKILIWGFGGHLRFMIWVWYLERHGGILSRVLHFDLDLDIVTCL